MINPADIGPSHRVVQRIFKLPLTPAAQLILIALIEPLYEAQNTEAISRPVLLDKIDPRVVSDGFSQLRKLGLVSKHTISGKITFEVKTTHELFRDSGRVKRSLSEVVVMQRNSATHLRNITEYWES